MNNEVDIISLIDCFYDIAGDVKFVCLNTNALEYDYSEPVPDFTFMENELTNRTDAVPRQSWFPMRVT